MHSPARWPLYCCSETSRLLKVNHYMLHVRIEMRLGGCVAFSQNIDTDTGPGVVRRYDPRSTTRGTACLTWVCLQGDIKASIHGQARSVLETTSFGYRDV
jgi:hypothetical protein